MVLYTELSDPDLSALLKRGDQKAFNEIFNRYNKLLYSHAFNKLRNADESQDLIQEVFVQIWEKREKLQFINLPGLLVTMVRNRIINLVSHQKIVFNYMDSLSSFMKGDNSGTDYLIREKQLAAIIEEEIAALPPKMRQVFEMSRKRHMSNKEIAVELDLSEHTVATQIKKSLRILRIKIGFAILMALLFGS